MMILAAAFVGGAASAQAQVVVRTLGPTHEPVAGARIALKVPSSGAWIEVGVSDPQGLTKVVIPRGATIRASKGDEISATQDVKTDQVTLVLQLPTVAVETVRTTPSQRNPGSLAAGSLSNSLRLNPHYRTAAEGGTGAAEVDGIPLQLPSGTNGIAGSNGYDSDLFGSVNLTSADGGGSTPDFHLVGPTSHPQQSVSVFTSSYSGSGNRATASGYVGKIGYGLSYLAKHDDGALAGRFADASGLTYDHGTNAGLTGDTLQFTYNSPGIGVRVSEIDQNAAANDVLLQQPGSVALGIGPGNTVSSRNQTQWISLMHNDDHLGLLFVEARFDGNGNQNDRRAVLAGVPMPFAFDYRYGGVYQTLRATHTSGSVAFFAQGTREAFAATDFASGQQATAWNGTSNYSVGATFTRRDVNVSLNGGFQNASGVLGGRNPMLEADVNLNTHGDRYDLKFDHEQSQTEASLAAGSEVYGSPLAASYNCGSKSVDIQGPSVIGNQHPTSDTLSASADLARSAAGKISFGGFASAQRNALVQDIAEQPAMLPVGYTSELANIFSIACPGESLQSTGVYVNRFVQMPHVYSLEAFVSDAWTFGAFNVSGFVEMLSRYTTSAVPGTPVSAIIPHAQLPGVPLHRSNLMLSYDTGKFLASVDGLYIDGSSQAYLPSHLELMAGIAMQLAHGQLSISAQNPFHSYDRHFMSPAYAAPVPTTAGLYTPLATPLGSNWTVKYTLSSGGF